MVRENCAITTVADGELVGEYVQTGSGEVFAELVGRHAGMVFGAALRVTRNRADAEDVTQQCFLELSRRAGSIQGPVAGWLHSVAVSRALDLLRQHASRRRRESVACRSEVQRPSEDITPYLDVALAELPDAQREAIVMHYLAGRSQAQIGAELGLDQSTISKRIRAGIGALRASLSAAGISAGAVVALPLLLEKMPAAEVSGSLVKVICRTCGGAKGMAAVLAKPVVAALGAVLAVAVVCGTYAATRPAEAVAATPEAAPAAENPFAGFERIEGNWTPDGAAMVGSGDSATLVSKQAWQSPNLVVEVDAIGTKEHPEYAWGIWCMIGPYHDMEEAKAGQGRMATFMVRGTSRGRFPFCMITPFGDGRWSRDKMVRPVISDVRAGLKTTYHIKAERLGTMYRMSIDGVPVAEYVDPSLTPDELYVWLKVENGTTRLSNLRVTVPDEEYVAAHEQPGRVFAPRAMRMQVLGKYPETIAREASMVVAPRNVNNGLREIPYQGKITVPVQASALTHGVACRRTDLATGLPMGMEIAVDEPEKWNCADALAVEVEYLDLGGGEFCVMHQSIYSSEHIATEGVALTGTGEWKTARFYLRDARFSAAMNTGIAFWMPTLRSDGQDLHYRKVRLLQISRPREAWEELVRAYEAEIARAPEAWTAAEYRFAIAEIYKHHLRREAEAERMVAEIGEKWPNASCMMTLADMRGCGMW